MGNSRTRKINYTPRLSHMEAYDLLPAPVQQALQEGPQQWDAYFILRWYRKEIKKGMLPPFNANQDTAEKMAIGGAVNMVNGWHQYEIDRTRSNPWGPKSPHKLAEATMQRRR